MRMMTSEDAGLTARALLVVLLAAAIIVGLAFASASRVRADGVSLKGVVGPLADKAREILAACPGTKVVSGRARRGNKSFHPQGRAVDITGNPKCVYAQLSDWKGGLSTDYWSVKCPTRKGWISCPHVHFDNGPRLRFTHRKPNKMFVTYAAAKAEAQP